MRRQGLKNGTRTIQYARANGRTLRPCGMAAPTDVGESEIHDVELLTLLIPRNSHVDIEHDPVACVLCCRAKQLENAKLTRPGLPEYEVVVSRMQPHAEVSFLILGDPTCKQSAAFREAHHAFESPAASEHSMFWVQKINLHDHVFVVLGASFILNFLERHQAVIKNRRVSSKARITTVELVDPLHATEITSIGCRPFRCW
mmetsp:Transcript_60423/g.168844  ORF Transcript_60423/g.168844 Transcript_60423/m.168844 type:complete len:201 (+) Transcript_60423:123-725(+)